MPLNLSSLLTPHTWQILERLRPQMCVRWQLFDHEFRPLLHESGDPADSFPGLFGETPEAPSEVAQAVARGEDVRILFNAQQVAASPVWGSQGLLGVIVVAGPVTTPAGGASHRRAQAGMADVLHAVHLLLDADVMPRRSPQAVSDHEQRIAASSRFLAYLTDVETEAEIFEGLLQAAAIWYDAEARIYSRDLDGQFVLSRALPGVATSDASEAEALLALDETSRSWEAERLAGSSGRHSLMLPLGMSGQHSSVLLIMGAAEPEIAQTFAGLCRAAGVRQRVLAQERAAALVGGVAERLMSASGVPPFDAALEQVCTALGATSATLAIRSTEPRSLQLLGGNGATPQTVAELVSGEPHASAHRLTLVLPLSAPDVILLDLRSDSTFTPADRDLADAALRPLALWAAASRSLSGLHS